jgi:MFS transporter, DHA2 family, multidrug resistance protein
VAAYSVHLMSQFNLFTDFSTIFWPRVVLGVGMGFLFVPLTTMTMSGVRKEGMGNATAIFNLLRNLGGSFGVAFVTTMLARRAQFHQARLVDHFTPFSRNLQQVLPQLSEILRERGFTSPLPDQGSLGVIYNQLLQQASMFSFNDAFYLLSLMMMLVLLLVPLMKKREEK